MFILDFEGNEKEIGLQFVLLLLANSFLGRNGLKMYMLLPLLIKN